MIKNIHIFESDPVPVAIAKLATPTIASMLVTVVYNMVDTFFVGQMGDPNKVAAVSIATPVFLFLMAAGNIFGIGGSTFISRALGEKQTEKIKHISSFCFYAGILIGIIGGAFFILGMPLILKMIGASEATGPYAAEYLYSIAWGAPAVVLSTAFPNLVRGEGAANNAMAGMMAGTVANIILDPIMILGMNMGVRGAAIATVIGNIVSLVFFLVHACGKKSMLSIKLSDFKIREKIALSVIAIGIPASLNNVLMSLSNIVMNKFLASYGDIQVASMGIAMKANMLVVFLQMGLAIGIQPLIGYSYGAKNFRRLKDVMKFSMVCVLIIGTVMTAIYIAFTRNIVGIFIDNEQVIETGCKMLRALMISGPVLGIMFVFNFSFQGMGKAGAALALSASRQGFVFLPMLFLGRAIAGQNGIIFAQPIADIISIIIALIMFISMNKEFKAIESKA